MLDRITKKVFLIIFIATLVVPLLLTNFKPNVVSELENRTLTKFPELYDSEGRKNEKYIKDFETWFNDNIGLRKELFAVNSKMQYDLFDNSAIEDVSIGDDGWLYYTRENNAKIASGEYPDFEEEILKEICNRQIVIKNRLSSQGIEYVLFLPPSKISIYPEYLKGNFEIIKTPVDVLADYIEANSDIKVIRLKEALLEEKVQTDKLLYFKTDTHWNAYGSYIAYKQIIKKLSEWNLIDTFPAEVEFLELSSMHDLTTMMVKNDQKYYEEAITNYQILAPAAIEIEEGARYNYIQQYVTDRNIRRGDYYENIDQDLPSFAVFGDSMFMDCLEPLMAENCSSLTCIWDYNITQEMIDGIKPDIVFSEMTERCLSSLRYTSDDFIKIQINVSNENILDITYCDFGRYSKMWFPAWSEADGQDDLMWYEPERSDEWTWHVSIDLNNHK